MDIPPLARHSSLIKDNTISFERFPDERKHHYDTELIIEEHKEDDELHHAAVGSCELGTPEPITRFISLKCSIETTGKEKS